MTTVALRTQRAAKELSRRRAARIDAWNFTSSLSATFGAPAGSEAPEARAHRGPSMIAARLGRGGALPHRLWSARHLSERTAPTIVAMGPREPKWVTEARALMAPQDSPLQLPCRVAVIRTGGGAFAQRWSGSPGASVSPMPLNVVFRIRTAICID
jgi:hypothetical protein